MVTVTDLNKLNMYGVAVAHEATITVNGEQVRVPSYIVDGFINSLDELERYVNLSEKSPNEAMQEWYEARTV